MAWGSCMRCGWQYELSDLRKEWTNLTVCPSCYDPRPAQLSPPRIGPEGLPLPNAAPEGTINPPASSLVDDFDDNSRNATKWNLGQFHAAAYITSGTAAETNGRVEITLTPSTDDSGTGYVSVNSFDISASSIFVHATIYGQDTLPTGQEAGLYFGPDADNRYVALLTGSSLSLRKREAGANFTIGTISYVPATHRWIRLRHNWADDTIHLDTAPNSASDPPRLGDWTSRISAAWDSGISTTGKAAFESHQWQATAAPVPVHFDGFNTGRFIHLEP